MFVVGTWSCVVWCLTLGSAFVLSLYMWPGALHADRDAPQEIKKRLISVSIVSVASLCGFYLFWIYPASGKMSTGFWQFIGLWPNSPWLGIIVPTALTVFLFFGPLVLSLMSPDICGVPYRCKLGQRFQDKLRGWLYALRLQLEYEATNIISWRTFVMGPLTEEIVFRGCMIPILCASGLSIQAACFMSPLVFGLAHVHHGIQRVVTKKAPILEVILGTIVQLTYTTIFGAYTSFILIRTGNLYACILAHSFCNVMGLPPFQEAIEHKYRFLICTSFVIGLVGFFLLLFPLTNPLWYSSVFVELLEGRPI